VLIVAGGDSDQNIQHWLRCLRRRRVRHHALLVGATSHPSLEWRLADGKFLIGGQLLKPTAAFIRHDVFGQMSDPRPETSFRAAGWFSSVQSWLETLPVRMFNRRARYPILKPHVLALAQRLGIEIPWTTVTNYLAELRANPSLPDFVVKPINGGDYCRNLAEVLPDTEIRAGVSATPAIIQERLITPDIRVYVVGRKIFVFKITSPCLDYRQDPSPAVEYITGFDPLLGAKLRRLNRALGLDFSASDLKTCARTGRLKFLEINSSPMFVAFDKASDGKLVDGMIEALGACSRGR
jgi:hypothetical protein